MDTLTLVTFIIVYLGMILGRIPGLALDRTGVSLLGAIVLLAFGRVSTGELQQAVDISTLALLLGLMVVSAQFRLAGAYSYLVRRAGRLSLSPPALLAVLVIGVAGLSAVLINDVICLAMTPVVIELCLQNNLNPKPYLLGLACSSNIGSAATLIGNPQNVLIAQTLDLSFSHYLLTSVIPVIAALILLWLILMYQYRRKLAMPASPASIETPDYSRWQTIKGVVVVLVLLAVFLFETWPRELAALVAAGLLLCSRRMRSREMLGLVDWQLLVLFTSLFIVNFTLRQTGGLDALVTRIADAGLDLQSPTWLFALTALLSNIVSNVPAVMLLLPLASHPMSGPILALSSTLAGNLLIVGSIANIIVVDQARLLGVRISWTEHFRTGLPVTLATLGAAAVWLWWLS